MPNILIADDNRQISSVLSEYAQKEGFEVYNAYDGRETMRLFQSVQTDIILLDVMMPQMDGFDVCREIRKTSTVPIIMITARGEDYERIMGLDIGADDYIVKPFPPGEVMARVRAVLRRVGWADNTGKPQVLRLDSLAVDLEHFQVLIDEREILLTKKETELLWTLMGNRNKVFTRDNLLDSIWGYDYTGDNRTVDSHIKRLRAKLDACPHPGWEIKTIWGMGYKFEVRDDA